MTINNNFKSRFIDYYLKQLGGKLIFSCNLRKDDISHINISNEFLKELLEIWTEVHFIQSNGLEENDIKNQLIWYNSFIRVENKPIYYKNWAANGIIKIKDFLDNGDILDFGKFQKKFNNLKAHYFAHKKTAKSITTTIRKETRTN